MKEDLPSFPREMPPEMEREIRRAAEALRRGELVIFPTETVYGIGADALNEAAVARVFEAKGRPRFDPLIVHAPDIASARALCAEVSELARALMKAFWPGPLTLVLPKAPHVPDIVTAGLPTVALRVPSERLALNLLRVFGGPVAAPSANRFGRLSPSTAEAAREELGSAAAVVLDGGPCKFGIESTVVSLAGDEPALLRPGALPALVIEALTGPLARPPREAGAAVQAPGMLERHYAPRLPLYLLEAAAPETGAAPLAPEKTALLCLDAPPPEAREFPFARVEALSPSRDLRAAACKFFAAMRRLEAMPLEAIVAAPFPEEGLGEAVNDRLRRGASGRAWARGGALLAAPSRPAIK